MLSEFLRSSLCNYESEKQSLSIERIHDVRGKGRAKLAMIRAMFDNQNRDDRGRNFRNGDRHDTSVVSLPYPVLKPEVVYEKAGA